MGDELPFERLDDGGSRVDACSVMARLVDGVGFRFRWATEGLPDDLADWRASPESMSFAEVIAHVHRLAAWTRSILANETMPPAPEGPPSSVRAATLDELARLRDVLTDTCDGDLADVRVERKDDAPFWNLINGPLADALTHVGQINAWRRQAGHPTPSADVFFGRPPGATPR